MDTAAPSRWLNAVEESAPKALHFALTCAVATAVTTALVAIAVSVLRHRAEGKAHRKRVAFRALPAETFDPSAEEIIRLAAQLARVRPAVSMAPRRAASLRLTLRTDAGRVVQEVAGPSAAASVLRMGGFAHVELERTDDGPLSTDTRSADRRPPRHRRRRARRGAHSRTQTTGNRPPTAADNGEQQR